MVRLGIRESTDHPMHEIYHLQRIRHQNAIFPWVERTPWAEPLESRHVRCLGTMPNRGQRHRQNLESHEMYKERYEPIQRLLRFQRHGSSNGPDRGAKPCRCKITGRGSLPRSLQHHAEPVANIWEKEIRLDSQWKSTQN